MAGWTNWCFCERLLLSLLECREKKYSYFWHCSGARSFPVLLVGETMVLMQGDQTNSWRCIEKSNDYLGNVSWKAVIAVKYSRDWDYINGHWILRVLHIINELSRPINAHIIIMHKVYIIKYYLPHSQLDTQFSLPYHHTFNNNRIAIPEILVV